MCLENSLTKDRKQAVAARVATLFLVVLIAMLLPAGCSSDSAVDPSGNKRAIEVWNQHFEVLTGGLEGEPTTEGEIREACRFFRQLTGIEVGGTGTPFGWMLNEKTEEDLPLLEQWINEHGDRLRWDQIENRVYLAQES